VRWRPHLVPYGDHPGVSAYQAWAVRARSTLRQYLRSRAHNGRRLRLARSADRRTCARHCMRVV